MSIAREKVVGEAFDPITLEILWSQLIAAADEQAMTIHRTAFSTVVRESFDFSCVLLNRQGDLLAQPYQSLPAFTRCASVVMKAFLARWPQWHPGDVAITNDPWLATGHLHDVAIAAPIFYRDRLVGFSANIAHQADIGGRGYSADANSIYEEGLSIPPLKLYREGRAIDEVLAIIGENVRVPDQVLGDINVQVTAARRASARVAEFLAQSGLDDLDALSDQILARSEAAMVEAIRRVPEGVYDNEGVMDGYDDPLRIRVRLTVRNGTVHYDFAGTSPQVGKGINSCLNFTYGYAAYATKAALEPLVPNNEGCYKPILVSAPEASLVNSRRPAPGNSRGRVGQMIVPVVYGALSKALPSVIPAEVGSPAPRANFFGDRADGSAYQCLVLTCGGLGAQSALDGISCKAFPSNTTIASLEVMESVAPLRFLERELRADSGGAGRHRGGLGQRIRIEVLAPQPSFVSTSADRMNHPPRGYYGGLPGKPAALALNDGGYLAPKARSAVAAGDVVTIDTPGGGGFGSPRERSIDALARDLAYGYVSSEQASTLYADAFADASRIAEAWDAERISAGQGARTARQADAPHGTTASRREGRYRLGVDIGGTFTDFVLIDTTTGTVRRAKTLSTPDDPVRGILDGVDQLVSELGIDPADFGRIVHGTTLVANTLIERKGARTALVTTQGFRDTLEIGNDTRYDIYDLQISFPEPLVPRHLRFGVRERIGSDGTPVEPLDVEGIEAVARALQAKRVDALALCFLHAYRNGEHERQARALLERMLPGVDVSISSEVAPEIREYERSSTVAANAYVRPLMRAYLSRIEHTLEQRGLAGPLFVMLSNGGVTSAASAAAVPIRLVESGPAGGVLAAVHSGINAGIGAGIDARDDTDSGNLIAFDMGGTTAKVCFVTHGRPPYTGSMEVARTKRQFQGSGIPTMVPSIEMVEIGAGGGSIASIARTGVLKVGPGSAGAVPGPACYGRGGDEATVTDADVLLGYVDPASFLGGRMMLDRERAHAAIGRVARRLGVAPEKAALGILDVVNHNMATAVRTHAAERGLDYRRYAIVASGGAGPVHVYELARLLGLASVVCPLGAGTNSALGFLIAPVAVDVSRSAYMRLDAVDWDALDALYAAMEEEARETLRAAHVERPRFELMAEMRFVGQGFEVTARVPHEALATRDAAALNAAFAGAYLELYGTSPGDLPVEALTWRLRAASDEPVPALEVEGDSGPGLAIRGQRRAWFPELGRFEDVPVYNRYALHAGMSFEGPALIEERESTLVVGPSGTVTVTASKDLIVRLSSP